MTILNKLAGALNRRDEVPNIELAIQIASNNDRKAIKELIDNLSNKSSDIQNDCIKVLYEIGDREPSLITAYTNDFIALLKHRNNRLQWGAMHALDAIVPEDPKMIYSMLPKIMEAAELGSVITRDHAVNILIKFCSEKHYASNGFALLIEQLKNSPTNQLPMYAERAMPVINEKNKALFVKTLKGRLGDIEKDPKRKRVEKIIKNLEL